MRTAFGVRRVRLTVGVGYEASIDLATYCWTGAEQADTLAVADRVAACVKQALDAARIAIPYLPRSSASTTAPESGRPEHPLIEPDDPDRR